MDNFDKSFNRMQNLISGTFIFAALAFCGVPLGVAFVVYKLLLHFEVL